MNLVLVNIAPVEPAQGWMARAHTDQRYFVPADSDLEPVRLSGTALAEKALVVIARENSGIVSQEQTSFRPASCR
jgi:hypothetical protein